MTAKDRWMKRLTPWFFLLIPLTLYIIWVIGPMLFTFYLSLTEWDALSAPQFIGLENYKELLNPTTPKGDRFLASLFNNLIWVAFFITVPVLLGLFLALALNRDVPGAKGFKAAFYSPMVLSLVVCGLIWTWMYQPEGLINSVLVKIGLMDPENAAGWLTDPNLALGSIIAVAIWRQVGYVMILFLAGLQSVDTSLVEASRIDGCNKVQSFIFVVLPQLAPITVVVVVISIIDSLRAFDLVKIMSISGDPNTSVLASYMYRVSFRNYQMGSGSAVAVLLFMISLVFILVYLSKIARDEGL